MRPSEKEKSMSRLFAASALSLVWLVLLTAGALAQSDTPNAPDAPDWAEFVQKKQWTVPPFEPPPGTLITVTTTTDEWNDDGDCSLREALAAANADAPVDACPAGNGKDLILLDSGVYTLALRGAREDDNATGDLDIRSSVILSSTGTVSETVIDGGQLDRVLQIHEGAAVEVRGLTVRNGRAPDGEWNNCDSRNSNCPREEGGGILNRGYLLLADSAVRENKSGDSSYAWVGGAGGGIFNAGGMTIARSQIVANVAGRTSNCAEGGPGGGIFNTGILSITQTIVRNNRTGFGGFCGKGRPPNGSGGGIANQGDLSITDSHIINNSAEDGSGGGIINEKDMWVDTTSLSHNIGVGGGVYNAGRAALSSSAVYSNTSQRSGGGIYNAVALSIINSTISGNRSGNGSRYSYYFPPSPAPLQNGFSGGGIFNRGWLNLESSTIAANTTGTGYCEKYTVEISVCAPGGEGGGLYTQDGTVYIHNSIIAQNTTGKGGSSPECSGMWTDRGSNLACRSKDTSSAWLAPLANNGGPTLTHALLPHSAALDAGECSTMTGAPLLEDQRGQPRPQGAGCDIGAVESAQATVPLTRSLYLPLVSRDAFFARTGVVCYSYSYTQIYALLAVDDILQASWNYKVMYSDSPGGPVLGELNRNSASWVYSIDFNRDDSTEGDWYLWVTNREEKRISSVVHIHTDGEKGNGTCQSATAIFLSR